MYIQRFCTLAVLKKPMEEKIVKTQTRTPLQAPTKTFQQEGKWIEKPHKTAILICTCGNRYLKTRLNQGTCIPCMHRQK